MTMETQTDGRQRGDRESEDGLVRAVADLRHAEMRLARRRQATRSLSDLDLAAIRIVVEAADEARDLTPTELAEGLQVSSASVTAMLRRLEDAGHVALRANPADRRSKFVLATDAGRSWSDPAAEGVARAAEDLDEDERMVVIAFLRRVAEEIDATAREDPSGR